MPSFMVLFYVFFYNCDYCRDSFKYIPICYTKVHSKVITVKVMQGNNLVSLSSRLERHSNKQQ